MSAEMGVSGDGLEAGRLDAEAGSWSARAPAWVRWPVSHWELIVGGLAVVAAAVVFWVTLHAHFLEHPGWLAVQKADFILGPIGVGLYWRHRRPHNRLGLLLIALGLLAIPYVGESTSSPWGFTIGTAFEYVLEPLTLAVILAFPNGRLGRVEWAILAVMLVGLTLADLVGLPTGAQFPPYFSISGCRAVCPANPWYSSSLTASIASALPAWVDVERLSVIIPFLAAVGLLAWRFLKGTPPRRRALAIGAPIAVCFLVASAAYQIIQLANPQLDVTNPKLETTWLQWAVAAGRSAVWYGFLFALIAAQLYAGRVLRRLNRESLGRPTFRELEGMLREPLGDPGLHLGFWRAESSEWVDAEGARLAAPGADQDATEVDRDGRAAIAIVHDKQLSEDPELLQAAGAVTLVALENAELEDAWQRSLGELRDSRARLARAAERERHKLERDLHDGAQQRLVTLQVRLRLLQEDEHKRDLDQRLEAIRLDAEDAVEDLRTLAHGIYPPLLRDRGLPDALLSVAMRAPVPIEVTDRGIGRCPPAIEAALYFCSLEAVQNALKHAGNGARVTVSFGRDERHVYFTVTDNGVGIAPAKATDGKGLVTMRDRISAVGGELEVITSPGTGTTIRGTAPTDWSTPPPAPTV